MSDPDAPETRLLKFGFLKTTQLILKVMRGRAHHPSTLQVSVWFDDVDNLVLVPRETVFASTAGP